MSGIGPLGFFAAQIDIPEAVNPCCNCVVALVSGLGQAMRRRDFIEAIASVAAAWPLTARAKEPGVPKVGWLSSASPEGSPALSYFRQGLADLGYVEGRNVTVEYKWARGHPELFPLLAADLVRANVSLIAAVSGAPAANAAKAATAVIPVVFITPGDPVQQGLVPSLNRPGGNITGLTMTNTVLMRKQIELLNELLPGRTPIAILSDPNTEAEDLEANAQQAGQTLDRPVIIINAASENDFDTALAMVVQEKASGLVVPDRPLFVSRHTQLAEVVSRYHIPAIYPPADLAASGGLMSYGASTFDMFRRAGQFAGKILSGTKPADIPVEEPTKIVLKINLKTAKALGLSVPLPILGRADEMIE
jgi:putative tryptophan/tyrosine transport system substrate-binding protein